MEKAEKTSSFSSDVKDIEEHSVIEEKITSKAHVYSSAEKKLLKKINWTFMPFVCVSLFIQV